MTLYRVRILEGVQGKDSEVPIDENLDFIWGFPQLKICFFMLKRFCLLFFLPKEGTFTSVVRKRVPFQFRGKTLPLMGGH